MSKPAFPYHPDYGLPDNLRQAAVVYAKEASVKEAAIKFRVHKFSIYNWLRDYTPTHKEATDVR